MGIALTYERREIMNFLKKFWPTPFTLKKGEWKDCVIKLVIFVVIMAIVGVVMGLLAQIPVVNIIVAIVGALLEVYGLVFILLCILRTTGVLNDDAGDNNKAE